MPLPVNVPKRGLSKEEAAEYCGVSPPRAMVEPKAGPPVSCDTILQGANGCRSRSLSQSEVCRKIRRPNIAACPRTRSAGTGRRPRKIGDRTIYDRRVLDLPGHRDRPVGPDTENLPLPPVTEVLAEAKNFRLPDEDNPEVQRWLREMGVGDADK